MFHFIAAVVFFLYHWQKNAAFLLVVPHIAVWGENSSTMSTDFELIPSLEIDSFRVPWQTASVSSLSVCVAILSHSAATNTSFCDPDNVDPGNTAAAEELWWLFSKNVSLQCFIFPKIILQLQICPFPAGVYEIFNSLKKMVNSTKAIRMCRHRGINIWQGKVS